jgi:large subunit ribosomal protein L17
MRNGKKFNQLGRKAPHRKAMLANMASSLISHKRISTTVAKAKALRMYVEPLITKSKNDTVHSRRTVFSYLQDKSATKELFDGIAAKVVDRPGGYTRIIRTVTRQGDAADMCIIELVDYNETYVSGDAKKKTRKRRTRRGGSAAAEKTATEEKAQTKPAEVKEEKEADTTEEVKNQEAPAEETKAQDTPAKDETDQAQDEPKGDDKEEKK